MPEDPSWPRASEWLAAPLGDVPPAMAVVGVPAHLTTYFGTNFAMRTAETPPPPGPEVIVTAHRPA